MTSRSANTKARLFEAALRLISERGFTGTTVDEIVERAGVAKGTVYYPDFAASALFGMTATSALDWLVFSPEQPLEHVAGQIASLAARSVRA